MNSKERVRRALTRQALPDRVPLQFDLCRSLGDRFAEKYGIPTHYTTSWFEDVTYRLSNNDLRVAMGSDCVVVGAGLPRGYSHPVDEDGLTVNEFGMRMRQGPIYVEVVGFPLANVSQPEEVERFEFPDPLADGRYADARMYIEKYQEDFFIVGDVELTVMSLMEELVGLEKLLIDMAMEAAYIPALLEKCKRFSLEIGKELVRLGVDAIWAGDDYGAQNGMLISPVMWRKYFKDEYRDIYAQFKAVNPDVIVAQHCDGAVAPILGDWIDVGLQVFNPVQPNVPGHEPDELKAKFGRRMSFWGAIDQQKLLPFGTPAEIEADVKRKIDTLGADGGYMVSPAHIIQADTPMDNVEAFITAVKKHGSYA